jgi:hypothetical protein
MRQRHRCGQAAYPAAHDGYMNTLCHSNLILHLVVLLFPPSSSVTDRNSVAISSDSARLEPHSCTIPTGSSEDTYLAMLHFACGIITWRSALSK